MSYTTLMRWHASFDAPLIETDWRITDLPFIEGQILLGNRWCSDDQDTVLRVGEAPTWAALRTKRGLKKIPAGLGGGHVCHKEWFATGEPWPVTLPDTEYNADGWPVCCLSPTEEITGGSESGGAVAHAYGYTHATSGGSMSGGAVAHTYGYLTQTSGGSESGGAVEQLVEYTHATSGGSESGGPVAHEAAYTHPTAGGSESGGPVEQLVEYTHATSGGSESGGPVAHEAAYTHPTAGGSESGGPVEQLVAYTHATSGGSESGGAVEQLVEYTHATSGGSESGGAVSHTFVPPTPTPGGSCLAAPTLSFGTTYNFTTNTGVASQQWVKWAGASASRIITTTALSGGTFFTNVYTGSSCAGLSGQVTVSSSPLLFHTDASGNLWMSVVNNPGGAHAWSVSVT